MGGALFPNLPPEFQGLAEDLRVRIRKLCLESYVHGLTDMAGTVSSTLRDMDLADIAQAVDTLPAIGAAEVHRKIREMEG